MPLCDIAMVGVGTMGGSFALNMADHRAYGERTDMPGLFHAVWELAEGAADAGPKAS